MYFSSSKLLQLYFQNCCFYLDAHVSYFTFKCIWFSCAFIQSALLYAALQKLFVCIVIGNFQKAKRVTSWTSAPKIRALSDYFGVCSCSEILEFMLLGVFIIYIIQIQTVFIFTLLSQMSHISMQARGSLQCDCLMPLAFWVLFAQVILMQFIIHFSGVKWLGYVRELLRADRCQMCMYVSVCLREREQ